MCNPFSKFQILILPLYQLQLYSLCFHSQINAITKLLLQSCFFSTQFSRGGGVAIGFSLRKGNLGYDVMLLESTSFLGTAFKFASAEKLDSVKDAWQLKMSQQEFFLILSVLFQKNCYIYANEQNPCLSQKWQVQFSKMPYSQGQCGCFKAS